MYWGGAEGVGGDKGGLRSGYVTFVVCRGLNFGDRVSSDHCNEIWGILASETDLHNMTWPQWAK